MITENLRDFFGIAAGQASWQLGLLRAGAPAATAARVLDLALGQAMVRFGSVFRLKPGEGREARARLLAASAAVLGPPETTMAPRETIAAWLQAGFSRLRPDQVVPLLAAAALEQTAHEELEARAG